MNNITNSFIGNNGVYKLIKTEQGDFTLWSENFNENCHSLSGALSETIHNYISPCNIINRFNNLETLNIFEVGFGLGIGYKATWEAIENSSNFCKIHYISVELDEKLVDWSSKNITIRSDKAPNLKELKYTNKNNFKKAYVENKYGSLTVLLGDAIITVPNAIKENIIPLINAIYQDPFSPRKNPALWSESWFKQLYNISDHNCILATYSSANVVKEALLSSKWHPETLTGFGQKRTIMRATINL